LVCELDDSGKVKAANPLGPTGLISRHMNSGRTF
jgi:hypothetical protein